MENYRKRCRSLNSKRRSERPSRRAPSKVPILPPFTRRRRRLSCLSWLQETRCTSGSKEIHSVSSPGSTGRLWTSSDGTRGAEQLPKRLYPNAEIPQNGEYCFEFLSHNLKWNDFACEHKLQYVCKKMACIHSTSTGQSSPAPAPCGIPP